MDAFAKHHQCSGGSMQRYVTYDGDYKEPMRPFLTGDELLSSAFSEAPSKRLKDVLPEYRLQHPGSSALEHFLAFAKTKGVCKFRGVKRLLHLEGKSIKDGAGPGATMQGNLANLTGHDGRVTRSQCRAAAEAWHNLNPADRGIADPATFAWNFGVTRAGMFYYVELDGTYTRRMLEILGTEGAGGTATPVERPAAAPEVARADSPSMTIQSASTPLFDLTEEEWATLQAVVEEARAPFPAPTPSDAAASAFRDLTEDHWATLQGGTG